MNFDTVGVIINTPAEIPIAVILAVGGQAPDPLHIHQLYLDTHFRITGTPTGAILEYFDGSAWHIAVQYP